WSSDVCSSDLYHQVNKDGDNDRQWPNPDQLAKCKAFPRGWASGSGCHIIFLSNVSNVHSIRRPPLTSDLVHCLGEECTYDLICLVTRITMTTSFGGG